MKTNVEEEPFKVIIAGSRGFTDYNLLEEKCDKILKSVDREIWVISGTAKGADQLGEKYAQNRGYYLLECPAPWDDIEGRPSSEIGTTSMGTPYWKKAGYARNREMAEIGDALIAFSKNESKGTKEMIRVARELGLNVREIKV